MTDAEAADAAYYALYQLATRGEFDPILRNNALWSVIATLGEIQEATKSPSRSGRAPA